MSTAFDRFHVWERAQIRATPIHIAQNYRIVESLLHEARVLGVFPPADLLEGIEVDLRWARANRLLAEFMAYESQAIQ